MTTDPIADMLTRIRNAQQARRKEVRMPYSKIKYEILNVLVKNQWLESVSLEKSGKFEEIKITLSEKPQPLVLKRKSKPGQRIYVKTSEVAPVLDGLGMSILSTPKGIMTGKEARKQQVGGELLCEIY